MSTISTLSILSHSVNATQKQVNPFRPFFYFLLIFEKYFLIFLKLPDTDTFYAPLSLPISNFKLVQNCSCNALTSAQNFTAVVLNIFLTQFKTHFNVRNSSFQVGTVSYWKKSAHLQTCVFPSLPSSQSTIWLEIFYCKAFEGRKDQNWTQYIMYCVIVVVGHVAVICTKSRVQWKALQILHEARVKRNSHLAGSILKNI